MGQGLGAPSVSLCEFVYLWSEDDPAPASILGPARQHMSPVSSKARYCRCPVGLYIFFIYTVQHSIEYLQLQRRRLCAVGLAAETTSIVSHFTQRVPPTTYPNTFLSTQCAGAESCCQPQRPTRPSRVSYCYQLLTTSGLARSLFEAAVGLNHKIAVAIEKSSCLSTIQCFPCQVQTRQPPCDSACNSWAAPAEYQHEHGLLGNVFPSIS